MGLVLCSGILMVVCGELDLVLRSSGVVIGLGCMRELRVGLSGGVVAISCPWTSLQRSEA